MGINRREPVPLYHQLKEVLLSKIERGELNPNTPIPSEKQLMEAYGLSRTTVRQAISELVAEGYLYRQRGKGTFVSRPKVQHGLRKLTSFSEDMRSRGLRPGSHVLEMRNVVPPKNIAAALELGEGEQALKIVRLRLANGEPMGIQTSYVPLRTGIKIDPEELEGEGSLYALLESRFNILLGEADETLEATVASETEARLLGVKRGSPLLLRERTTFSLDGKPIEFVKALYRADRYRYLVHLTR
ncbi:MAG: GntR family transcriptional regulator [Chloroflexi bacterium]|nr:GntR family transcriptional regulator [Chloroflexota bacterium]